MMLPILALAFLQSSRSVDERVEETLSKMSLDEKMNYVSGIDGFYVRAIPRLGLPSLKMSDGPAGVRNYGPTTAYPAGVCLASAWDSALAREFGNSIGEDARARGVNIWLGPGVNLARIPQNGRNFEYFGEDPWLASRMAANLVRGVESKGVVATVKHFVANDHENDRNRDSSNVDERTLRELYLKPFEAAVREGGASAIMTGYNKLNGKYASENSWLLQTVLKGDWGFKGVAMSDWGGTYGTGPIKAGLDLEMPGAHYMSPQTIGPMIGTGELPMSALDDKVRRLLRMTYEKGFADRPQQIATLPKDNPHSMATAMQIAREGIVLLKDDHGVLPIKPSVRRILLVGPNADPPVTGGGGSAYTTPIRSVSLLAALKKLAGPGIIIDRRAGMEDIVRRAISFSGYSQPDGTPGLKAEYFSGRRLGGTPLLTRIEPRLDHDWGSQAPAPGVPQTHFAARWTGAITPPTSGLYMLAVRADDGMRISVNGKRVLNAWGDHAAALSVASLKLEAGKHYNIRVDYYQNEGDAVAQFGILPLEQAMHDALPAGELAKADLVVASVGFNPGSEGEGNDRPFDLPFEQQLLLDALMPAARKTVIVNNSGAGVNLAKWSDRFAGLIQAWYPGGEGATALAEIIFGATNPSGKLATTFPRTLRGTYYEHAYPPINHNLDYSEGLLMGYRWFDAKKQKPLFPFGFGLSYTKFRFSHLQTAQSSGRLVVTCDVKNTGRVAGSEVVEVYIGAPGKVIMQPVKQLRAFKRIELQPGETHAVSMDIPSGNLKYYDVASHAWSLEPGAYRIYVGSSSADTPLVGTMNLP